MIPSRFRSPYPAQTASAVVAPPSRQTLVADIADMLGQQFALYTSVSQTILAAKLDMALSDIKALDFIMTIDELSTGQLTNMLGVSAGGMTAIINRLELAGYVTRARHPLDRRVIIVRPVADRCDPLREDRQYLIDQVSVLASQYDHEQLAMMHGFLSQCIRHLKRDTLRWMEQSNRQRLAA